MTEAAPAPAFASPRPAPGIGPDGTYTRAGQVLAFLAGLWAMVLFFPLLFAGALLYARAEERFRDDPARARTLVLWSWFAITIGPPIGFLLVFAVTRVAFG
ncbi:hypothetical protein ACFY4C_15700 [Actinomadura viridis]|uniref:hypothetical protein n=1 Tax=Actinomadura viridis TaxID=58110 RepID=UPI0036B64F5A